MEPFDGQDARNEEYNRPRRPNADTLSYLVSLPLEITALEAQMKEFVDNGEKKDEFPPLLGMALSALDEIRNELASLAGDERGSQIVEKLFHMVLPHSESAVRMCWHGFSTYHLHLATHRYGSHVVQTLIQLSGAPSGQKDMGLHQEAPDTTLTNSQIPTLLDLVQGMVDELTPHASVLAVHICGSHVLRSLICLLGGVELRESHGTGDALRRGKLKNKKKKRKKGAGSEDPVGSPGSAAKMEIHYLRKPPLDISGDTKATLQSLLQSMWEGPQFRRAGKLQETAIHPSAGPLLTVSLRVMTYVHSENKQDWYKKDETNLPARDRLSILAAEPRFLVDSPAHELAKRVLCLDSDQAGHVIYGLAGEPRGSHVLETLLRISPDKVYEQILKKGDFIQSAKEYVQDSVSNHVYQTLLATARTSEQSQELLKGLEKLLQSGYILDVNNQRRGILWRLVEMLAKQRVGQESFLKMLRIGMGNVVNGSTLDDDDDKETEGPEDEQATNEKKKKKKKRQKALSIPLKACIVPLLGVKLPETDGDRLRLDVAGARTLYHLLRFTPRLCEEVLLGTTEKLSREELEAIAKDGLGSRCIMDGILDGPMHEKAFAKAPRQLLEKLGGRWVALATDRVGHHTVKKLFRSLGVEDKVKLVVELSQSTNRLSGSSMGRNVMEACSVSQYLSKGENEWKNTIRKELSREQWLQEIVESDEVVTKKRTRKRKRTKGRKEPEADLVETSDKKQPKVSVDSILDVFENAIKKK